MANSKLKRARAQTNPQKQTSSNARQQQQSALNIMDFYLNSFLGGNEMTPMQLENVALILKHSPIEGISKETLLQILERLCSNPKDLLESAQKLQIFNVFLTRIEFGLPLPVEFAIGVLFQNPQVVNRRMSDEVRLEIDNCRKNCEKLLECRTIKLDDEQLIDEPTSSQTIVEQTTCIVEEPAIKPIIKERPETPPICITLDDDSQENVLTVENEDISKSKTVTPAEVIVEENNMDVEENRENNTTSNELIDNTLNNDEIVIEEDGNNSDHSDINEEDGNNSDHSDIIEMNTNKTSNIQGKTTEFLIEDKSSSDSDIIIEEPTTSGFAPAKTTPHDMDLIVKSQKEKDNAAPKEIDMDLVDLF